MAENEIIELMKQGDAYLENKEYEKAIDVYTKVIGIDPEYKEAYKNRGNALSRLGRHEEAAEEYTKTIEIDPKYEKAYIGRGNVYNYQGKYEEAVMEYTKAIEIDPKCKVAYNNRGNSYYYQKKYEEAMSDFAKAIEIDMKYKLAYNNRGNSYYDQKKYEKAIADYTEAIGIDPEYGKAYNNRGLAYYYQGKYEEAMEDLIKALEVEYKYESAYRNLQDICKKRNNYPDLYYVATVKFYDIKFYNYIEKIEENTDIRIRIYKLYTAVTELKNKLRHTDFEAVGHYTKISNLKHLIKPVDQKPENEEKKSEKPKEGRLRLNNVSYMNDPTEGEVFIQLLVEYIKKEKQGLIYDLYTNKSDNKREVLSGKNHVFLVSFSSAIDTSLPLWVQYSENGEGCCLVFEESFFDKEDRTSLSYSLECEAGQIGELLAADIGDKSIHKKEKEKPNYCLYKVKYVKGEDDGYKLEEEELSKSIKEIGKQLIGFEDDLKEGSKSTVRGIIQNILDQVRFLFKDKNYEHEEEVRLVKFEDNGNVKYTSDAEGFRVPHVYIELEKEMKLKEVILGPKVQNTAEIASYLYYTEKVDEVSKSKIKYK